MSPVAAPHPMRSLVAAHLNERDPLGHEVIREAGRQVVDVSRPVTVERNPVYAPPALTNNPDSHID
jgi:hypothetical protein